LLAALFLAVRLPNLHAPFVNLLDTGFQEAIALHHLDGQVWANRLLPVISEVDGKKIFHTAHPPLLHLLYAGAYSMFGAREWVSRAGSLLLYFGTIFLWTRFLLGGKRSPGLLAGFAFFLPLPFALALTTNYEPLCIFSITLIAATFMCWQEKRTWSALTALFAAVLVASFSDWPVYLAVPTLLLMNRRREQGRNLLLALILFEAMIFGAILLWQRAVTGEVVFFSHATTRNDPRTILQFGTYRLLWDHLGDLLGLGPFLLVMVFSPNEFRTARRGRRA